MGINQLSTAPAAQSRWRDILTVGSIFILGVVWALFFLWATTITESWLAQWRAQTEEFSPANWQVTVQAFLSSETGSYLPAMILLLASLVLFFYRVPRVRVRLTVPLEFAVITLMFLVANVATLYFLHALVARALAEPGVFQSGGGEPLPPIAVDVLVTSLMLAILFWLQGSGHMRWLWRKLSRGRTSI